VLLLDRDISASHKSLDLEICSDVLTSLAIYAVVADAPVTSERRHRVSS